MPVSIAIVAVGKLVANASRHARIDDDFLGDDVTAGTEDARGMAAVPDGARQRGDGHAAGVARSEAQGEMNGCPRRGQ